MASRSSAMMWVLFLIAELWVVIQSFNTIMVCFQGTQATTDPRDVEAMLNVKSSIEPATIPASSCLASWDFTLDPCDNKFRSKFVCGFDCVVEQKSSMQRVTNLDLDSAGYVGILSPWIGNLSSLRSLRVSWNSFRGPIPQNMGKLSQLVIMDLSFNVFSGHVPDTIGMLPSLQTLNLAGNVFEGQVPQSIQGLVCLTELHLEQNRFTGCVPDLLNLTQLQFLDLSNNGFTGSLTPWSLPTLLYSACIRNNSLTGRVPKSIVDMQQLSVLDLSGNQLHGPIDDTLLAHPSLQQLNLSYNRFSELRVHPKHISGSQLVAVDLSYNAIAGTLPSFFGHMKHLSALSLRHNLFHGLIPQSFAVKATQVAGGAQPLERLFLDGNYLTGPLPEPFMNIVTEHSSLTASFGDNCLQECPAQYGFCQGGRQKEERVCRLFNPSS